MHQQHDTLIRLTPKKAPFRRAHVHFTSMDPVVRPIVDFTARQLLQLVEEPLVDVDESFDGGEFWRRHSLPPEGRARPVTDAALSPERAVDPSGPIVPRAPVPTPDGAAAPPSAADPAVPIARPESIAAGAARDALADADSAAALDPTDSGALSLGWTSLSTGFGDRFDSADRPVLGDVGDAGAGEILDPVIEADATVLAAEADTLAGEGRQARDRPVARTEPKAAAEARKGRHTPRVA